MRGKNSRSAPDHYATRAKKEGYPARSVYKLKEIQQKFSLIREGHTVLDLGAAPGSWSKYALELVRSGGKVIGVDRKPWQVSGSDSRISCVTGDIFDEKLMDSILEHVRPDVIMSDAAPDTTGTRTIDSARSMALAEQVLTLCTRYLSHHGSMIVKVFQGPDFQAYSANARKLFESVKVFKPKACRSDSFEVYLLGIGKKVDLRDNN